MSRCSISMSVRSLVLLVLAILGTAAAVAEDRVVPVDSMEDRRWIGAAWQPSRLQDWRIEDGRLVNDDARLPVRTAHALTLRLDPKTPASPISLVTTVRAVGDGRIEPGAFAGVLLGAGGPEVDPRLTALVQQVPAPDGGLLAVVDGSGGPRLLDFSTPRTGGFSWTLPRKTSLESLEPLAGSKVELATAPAGGRTFEVRVTIIPRPEDRYDLRLEIGAGDMIFGVASATDLPREAIDGGLALVSHRGPRKMGIGWSFDGLRVSSRDLGAWLDETDHSWGPVLATAYTIDRTDDAMHDLRLTAMFPPLEASSLGDVALELRTRDGVWRPVATGRLEDLSNTVRFHVPSVDEHLGRDYRVVGTCDGVPFERIGMLHEAPEDRPFRVAVMSCVKNITAHTAWNRQGVWYPHEDLVERVAAQDPDLYFFAGDQIYEGDVTGVDFKRIELDYHTKYQRWLRSFGELFRDRPVVIIPDDHDVYHGNIWGAGGIKAKARDGFTQQDAGGYKLDADMVNAVHRTQVGNLPESMVPGPIGQGIEPYATRLRYGPVDCAIVADRMWKDSASVKLPAGEVRNGWFRNPDFDPKDGDVADAEFLGPTQEAFLAEWATERDPRSTRKLVLSQTPWVNVATLPPGKDDGVVPGLKIFPRGGYAENDVPAADTDSGGWPQSARRRAVRSISEAGAIHLAGDQHLGSLLQYGVDSFRDGAYAFTPPAVANTWPRRWMPIEAGANRWEGAPRYAGDYEDGFGNLMTVYSVTNPEDRGIEPRRLHDLSPGYGIVEIDPVTGDATLGCWPRWGDPTDPTTQYEGFPFKVGSQP